MKKWVLLFLSAWLCNCLAQTVCLAETASAEPLLEKVPIRPNADAGPTKVSVTVWVIDIDSINSAQQNFVVNVYLCLRWNDPRLAHGQKAPKRYASADIWTPRVQIANEIGIVRWTMADFVDVDGDGTVTYRQRYVGPLSQPLKLHDFPFDEHRFRIHFVSMKSGDGEIQFVPDATIISKGLPYASGISPDISLPDWFVQSYEARSFPYVISDQLKAAGYAFEFVAKRDSRYFVWKVFLPLILIVMMSWVSFWIDPKQIGTNISAVMTSMLTLVAYRFTFESYIPKVGYMTRIDNFMLWSTLLVFFSIIQVAINSKLVTKERCDIAVWIDRVARFVYPAFFILITVRTLKF